MVALGGRMAIGSARIKGTVLQSRLRLVRERGGAAGLERVLGRLSAADRNLLRGINGADWFPLELESRLDEAIARELSPFARERIFIEMGRASADLGLATPQQQGWLGREPHHLLSQAPLIYRTYYAVGHRTYERVGERSARLRTFEAESVTANDCLTVVGWHERAIELSGGRQVRVVEECCRAKGADHCAYLCTWE